MDQSALSRERLLVAAVIVGMLLTGSINTITKKQQNGVHAIGIDGTVHKFHHPYFQTLPMFFGELLCLFAFLVQRWDRRRVRLRGGELTPSSRYDFDINSGFGDSRQIHQTSNQPQGEKQQPKHEPRVFQPIFAVTGLCDFLATTLDGVSLLYILPSIWLMLRGSLVLFSAALSFLFLKLRLYPSQIFGLMGVCVGLVMVGVTSLLTKHATADDLSLQFLGITLTLTAQLCSASQMVFEEKFVRAKHYLPLQVPANEGTFGVVFLCFLVLPVLYFIPGNQVSEVGTHGSFENSLDAVVQIYHSSELLWLTIVNTLSISVYRTLVIVMALKRSALQRTLIDACRTLVVWMVDLFLYYVVSENWGEPWGKYSGLEAAGFLVLTFGTLVYTSSLRCLPFLRYPPLTPPPRSPPPSPQPPTRASSDLASPLLLDF